MNLSTFILDTLFPIHCLNCQQEGMWLCQECLEKIDLLPVQVCPYCENNITEKGQICVPCQKKYWDKNKKAPLESLLVSAKYTSPLVAKMIHLYKYNFISDLHIPLGKILIKNILKINLELPDFIVPVPLHPRRLRWRGFNQSELLARYIGENITPGFSIPLLTSLVKREKFTSPQMELTDYQERKKNIQNAFSISPDSPFKKAIVEKKILLVDDVTTTGSTILECARILQENGGKTIMGAVIARQEIKN